MTRVMKSRLHIGLILLMGFAIACGDESSDEDFEQQQDQEQDGDFQAVLAPVGSNFAQGTADFQVSSDQFSAQVNMQALTTGGLQRQYLFSGNACPDSSQDTDGNGQISIGEASSVSGLILVPLDNDLSEQLAGGVYPSAGVDGTYTYTGTTDLEDMIDELRFPDSNEADLITKLSPNERLNMEGRTVLVTEVQAGVENVQSCGVVTRL